jgi:hypothetical protein
LAAKITNAAVKATEMLTDSDTITKAQQQMNRAALDIAKLANDVADAKTIKEFSGDRMKRALSVQVASFLETGDSGVAAEHKSRASKEYGTHLHDLEEQYKTAMRVIEKYEGLKVRFESARSILSVERQKLGLT